MTFEQTERQILQLVHGLPILRRIKLALTILKEVEPNQIPLSSQEEEPGPEESDQLLAEKLLQRKTKHEQGNGKHLSREEFMAKVYAELDPKA